MSIRAGVLAAGLVATLACAHTVSAAVSCESLSTLKLPNTTFTLAATVPAGGFAAQNLPAFCRVAATLTPTSDSDIKMEVWLPLAGWNGKLLAVGNGGWAGSIEHGAMGQGLARGYATTSTDGGHEGEGGSFALGHPEKLIDYAWRSEHEMTVTAKALIAAYYGNGPRFSYFNGCSAGGKQGLKEAQRFPADFDGIIAGAPGADWTGRATQSVRVAQIMHKDAASYIPPSKYQVIHKAVVDKCDALDGVKDGVLDNPKSCSFDPGVLVCTPSTSLRAGNDESACLTPPQVASARQVYATMTNPKSKREIPGLAPGSELGWATWGGPQPLGLGADHFKYVVYKDPKWDYMTFNFDRDIVRAEEIDNGLINALDPNLKPFFDRGGKLVQYHGWNDPQIAPGNSVQYYTRVRETLGGASKIDASYRLFMMPGMAHCRGGEGPNTFDALAALEQWVEKGKAPDQIVASLARDGKVVRTRPLCPYPQQAVYKGSGSTDEAANFACKMP